MMATKKTQVGPFRVPVDRVLGEGRPSTREDLVARAKRHCRGLGERKVAPANPDEEVRRLPRPSVPPGRPSSFLGRGPLSLPRGEEDEDE